jgi:hypothetical protein
MRIEIRRRLAVEPRVSGRGSAAADAGTCAFGCSRAPGGRTDFCDSMFRMETNQLKRHIKDLEDRTDSLRRYL